MGHAWKCAWPSACRTIHGWRFCFANKAIRSAADCARGCKSSLQKDSPQPSSNATKTFRAFGNCVSRFPERNWSILSNRLGKPIRYEYVSAPWDLDYYQTVYAKEPGSAEMPSAGRAFTWKLLLDLKRRGIESAYIVLHTGLSSYMDDELDRAHPASEEEYFVSATIAEKINRARKSGGRVIAVGTTAVRALESAVDESGRVRAQHAYTRLRIDNKHRLKAVDGLLTGLHEPEASHLDLLSAFLPAEQIRAAYEEAIERRYLWHEFGDLNLIL